MKNRNKSLIILLSALLAINIAVLLFILFPKRSDISNWSGIVIRLQKDIYSLSAQNREIMNKKKLLEETRGQILDFKQNRLGYRTSQLKKIMETIDDLVYRYNLKRGRTAYIQVPIKNDDFEKMRIQFTVQGNYQSVRYFINSLERSPLFLALNTLALMSNQSEDQIQLNIGIETFFIKTGL